MDRRRRQGALLTVIRTVAATGSTNADLLALARTGVEEGLWLRAEQQTAGRGRQGREWDSPTGNLYTSTLVRLRAGDPPAASLALVAAVALDEVVDGAIAEPSRRRLALKWPNDLLIDGAKTSGILLERADDAVVIGIGVNIAFRPVLADRVATSLAEHGAAVTPADMLEQLANLFAAWLSIWRSDGLAPIIARWTERAHPLGTPLGVNLPAGTRAEGAFGGLSADGALLLRLAGGDARVIHAGDVFLV